MEQDQGEDSEITFVVEPDFESGTLVAFWDDPSGGGITTQADNLANLAEAIKDAVFCHFGDGTMPRRANLHFANAELQLA